MKKIYNYEKCVITITNVRDEVTDVLYNATEKFLRRLMIEESRNNGNTNTTRNIREEKILDKQE